jgi:hypothetical protein
MSVQAMGWVIAESPYKASAFLVHLMIADVVNDQHGFEFWMSNDRLAQKARLSRQTVNRSIGQMVADGFLVPVGTERCGNVRYRFHMPSTKPCGQPKKVSQDATPGVTGGDTKQKRTQRELKYEGVTNGDTCERVLTSAENAHEARKARTR